MPAQKFSAKEAARELGTDARSLRKFLRSKQSPIEAVGQGNRYEFTKADIAKLKKVYSNGSKPKPVEEDLTIDDEGEFVGIGEFAGEVGEMLDRIAEAAPLDIDDSDEEVDLDEDVDLMDLDGPSDDDLEEIELED